MGMEAQRERVQEEVWASTCTQHRDTAFSTTPAVEGRVKLGDWLKTGCWGQKRKFLRHETHKHIYMLMPIIWGKRKQWRFQGKENEEIFSNAGEKTWGRWEGMGFRIHRCLSVLHRYRDTVPLWEMWGPAQIHSHSNYNCDLMYALGRVEGNISKS